MITSAPWLSITLLLVIILTPSINMAQTIVVDDKSNDITPTIEARDIDSSRISIESPVGITAEAISTEVSNREVRPGFSVFEAPEGRDMKSDEYVASIDLGRLVWPEDGQDGMRNSVGSLMLGLKRPHYSFGEEMRFVGLVDLKVAGSLVGLGNSATMTFRYDLRRNHDERSIKMSMILVHISYKISIPFGNRTEKRHR